MAFQIELDMANCTTRNASNRICVHGKAREELTAYGLASTVIQEVGPAGGNPLVRVYGSHIAIVKYMKEVYLKDDTSDFEEVYEPMIVPYVQMQAATLQD